jgi:cell division transport system permease protein
MLVEIDDDISVAERDSLSNTIAANKMVAKVEFVSKDQKLADPAFRHAFDVDVESLMGKNPLPDSFDVTLSAEAADSEALTAFVEQLTAMPEVAHISYPEDMVEQVHSVLDTMQFLLLLFGGAMLLISVVLLNNTIRLAIFSRRYLINTLKLVGATKGYIMRPFIATAAKQGLWAGIVASMLFGATIMSLSGALPEIISVTELQKIGIVVGSMILCGLIISLLFTIFAVNKFVNMKSNKIYLY